MGLMVGGARFLPRYAVLLTLKRRRGISLTALMTLFLLFSPLLAENTQAALITAEPTQGPAGTQVMIRGSAWPPGDLIKLSWNFPPFVTVATARTDGNGAFTAMITVPQNAPIGPTEVNAINEAGTRTWQASFTVTAGQGQLPPEIVRVETFREGVLVFLRVFYTDPNNDAEGFGFRGANGSLWAEESHPFSSPSYGRVYPGIIEYPFNHGCGTPSQSESDVAVWIYDRAGLISQVVTVHLACSAGQAPPRLTLSPKQSSFLPGDTHILTATVTPGDSALPVDVYLALKLPDQTLHSYQSNGSFTQEVQPLVSNWTVRPFSGEIFRYTFTGTEQTGTYTWYAAFTDPGTLNIIGDIAQATFTLPVSRTPAGKAPNLVVLVHGCCTDENGVKEWDELGRLIAGTIHAPGTWEIVVWDWHGSTPPPPGTIDWVAAFKTYADIAYGAAENEGLFLEIAIEKHTYKYIHLIGHSAGARLIDQAALLLSARYSGDPNKPFIHLTFLDAYAPSEGNKVLYGFYADYAEQYVDRSLASILAPTDVCLSNAFNFNISNWLHSPEELLYAGHQWPRHWYEQSVTSTSPKFKYGYPLSFEGGNGNYKELAELPIKGKQCELSTLFDGNPTCYPADCWK